MVKHLDIKLQWTFPFIEILKNHTIGLLKVSIFFYGPFTFMQEPMRLNNNKKKTTSRK